jgi:alanine dehydrogenase
MEHAALPELLAQKLTAAFGTRFTPTDYTVDSIPFYGKRTLEHFDIAADPGVIIRDVMQALVAMKARGKLRFHNDDFPTAAEDRSRIVAVPPCVISICNDTPTAQEKITFRFDVEVTAGQTRVAP